MIDKERESNNQVLLVDSGNIFFKPGAVSAEQQVLSSIPLAMAQVYKMIGYDAISLSASDLSLGEAFYLSQAGKSLPFVSANIADQQGKLVFPPLKSFTRNGLQVAVCGISGGSEQLPAGFTLRPWQESLAAITEDLQRHDFVILLSSLNQKENEELTATYPGVNLIISSTRSSGNKPPALHNSSLIAQSEPRGKYLGKLELSIFPKGRWQLDGQHPSPAEQYRRQLDGLVWQQDKIRMKQLPEEEKNSQLQELAGQISLVQQKLNEAQIKENQELPETSINRFQSTFLPVAPLSNPEIDMLLRQARDHQAENRPNPPAVQQPRLLAGSQQCGSCHQPQYAFWQNTAHAGAYQTLLAKGQDRNLDCLGCHVTSPLAQAARDRYPSNGLLSIDQSLRAVGCETCHGDGLNHIQAPEKTPLRGPVAASICLSCHTGERDDDFDFTRKRSLIACPLNG